MYHGLTLITVDQSFPDRNYCWGYSDEWLQRILVRLAKRCPPMVVGNNVILRPNPGSSSLRHLPEPRVGEILVAKVLPATGNERSPWARFWCLKTEFDRKLAERRTQS